MARVVHFEIQAEDPERAAVFYTAVFGWEIMRWNGPQDYWLITTGQSPEPGIDGAIMRRRGGPPLEGQPMNGFVNTMDVASVDEVSKLVLEKGGKIVVPKTSVPDVGWLVYCKDTEGNIFGLMENDTSTK